MIYTAEDFKRDFDVSRETLQKLTIFHDLLLKWQRKINLISPETKNDIWFRHFADSAQVAKIIPQDKKNIDLGSGGGFPALVLSCLGYNHITLVESDARKCAFLRTVIRDAKLSATVINDRAENLTITADYVTARALASLDILLGFANPLAPEAVFLKGQRYKNEIENAKKQYDFTFETYQSVTDENAVVFHVKHISL